MDISKLGLPASNPIEKAQQATLTPDQKAALERLHTAATQFEGVFLQMMFKAMHDTVPKQSMFGKDDGSEETFSGMLDDQRAQSLASTGALGIAKVMENQLRASVLGNAAHEATVHVDAELKP